jgi:hypothetical protein
MKSLLLKAVSGLLLAATPALAGIHYFTQTTTLHKYDGSLSSVAITGLSGGETVPGLGFHDGELWATTTAGNVYTIDASGSATFKFSFAGSPSVTTFDFIDVNNDGQLDMVALSGNNILRYDLAGNSLGTLTNAAGSGFPSSAYLGGTYYGARNSSELFAIDETNGSASNLGTITDADNGGATLSWKLAGGSAFKGDYWLAVAQGSTVRIGTLDTNTLSFDDSLSFNFNQQAAAMGYAITPIPAPGAGLLALLGTGAIAALRRRIS